MSGRFEKRVALITGGSRGIGRAVALALAKEGADLILVARDKHGLAHIDDKVREVGGSSALLVPMDLADGAAIDRLGGAIFDRWGRLDILLGNGGILGPLSPVAHIEPSTWDYVLNVNLTANFRLMRSMELLLKQSPAARCAFVSSSAVRSLRPFWAAYATSKAGLEGLVRVWAKECADSNIKVNLFEPGKVRTDMRAEAVQDEDPMSLPSPEEIISPLLDILHVDYQETGQHIKA